MSVRERILAIRIAEAISKHPEIAEKLGISAELAERSAVLKEPHERKTMGNYIDPSSSKCVVSTPIHLT